MFLISYSATTVHLATMDFVGFSSDEEDECDPFPPIPTDRKEFSTQSEEQAMSSSINQEGTSFQKYSTVLKVETIFKYSGKF